MNQFILKASWIFCLSFISCSTVRYRPCTEGGQNPRENGVQILGVTKRCSQVADQFGVYLNDGKYYEWHPNEKLALEGEYKMGKKTGRWIEYDPEGKKISDKYFENGKEIDRP